MAFGIQSPELHNVLAYAVSFGAPALLAVLCLWVVFHLGAFEERRKTKSHAEQKPTSQPAGTPQNTTKSPTRELSNAQLRDRAIALSNEMRTFDANFSARQGMRYRAAMGPDSQEAWESRMRTEEQQRAVFEISFRTRYRPEALSLWHEIDGRLGITRLPNDREVPIALGDNMLAGIHPVTEAADFLDRLARQLP